MVVAVAHIRGGGEMGKAWHDDGRMMHKKNTFTDFIASAEYLVAQGYGAKDRLCIEGEKRWWPVNGSRRSICAPISFTPLSSACPSSTS